MDATFDYGQMLDDFPNRPAVSCRLEAPLLKRESVNSLKESITRGCQVVLSPGFSFSAQGSHSFGRRRAHSDSFLNIGSRLN